MVVYKTGFLSVPNELKSMSHTSSEGHPTISFSNGDRYTGETCNGYRHGRGTFTSPNSIYVGEWSSGVRHGKGIEYRSETAISSDLSRLTPGSSIYSGSFQKGFPNGQGSMQWLSTSLTSYSGEWNGGKMEGYGTANWLSSDQLRIYEGDWLQGLPNGKGVMVWVPLQSLKPQDVAQIHSALQWENPFTDQATPKLVSITFLASLASISAVNYYSGEFENGSKSGRGVFYYADSSIYDGEWKADDKAVGILTGSDGRVKGSSVTNLYDPASFLNVRDTFESEVAYKDAVGAVLTNLSLFKEAFQWYRLNFLQLYTFDTGLTGEIVQTKSQTSVKSLTRLTTAPLAALWQCLYDSELVNATNSIVEISRSIPKHLDSSPVDLLDPNRRILYREFVDSFVRSCERNRKRVAEGLVKLRGVIGFSNPIFNDPLVLSCFPVLRNTWLEVAGFGRPLSCDPKFIKIDYLPVGKNPPKPLQKRTVRLDGTIQVHCKVSDLISWLKKQVIVGEGTEGGVREGYKSELSRIIPQTVDSASILDQIQVTGQVIDDAKKVEELDWFEFVSEGNVLSIIQEIGHPSTDSIMKKEVCLFEYAWLMVKLIEHGVAKARTVVLPSSREEHIRIMLPILIRPDRWLERNINGHGIDEGSE